MCAAFNLAGQVAAGWTHAHRDSFPPIVINITDGIPTDGRPGEIEEWGRRIRSLRTDDGEVLLFTIHLPLQIGQPVSFPSSENGLPGDDFRQMFRLSSVLPEFMRLRAGAQVAPGARGLVCNADMNAAIHALQVGTSVDYLANF